MEDDKYKDMTNEDFNRILKDIVSKLTADQILAYGEVGAILSEELNNDVLTAWEQEQSAISCLKERDVILFGEVIDWPKGGCKDITGITLETAKKLLEMGYIDKDDTGAEGAPEFGELVGALEVAPDKLTLSGHAHSDRIDIDSINGKNLTPTELNQLVWLVHWANDYNLDIEGGVIYAWWD